MTTDPKPPILMHECDNCGKIFHDNELDVIEDLDSRVDPGGEVPSGECPVCGALCYLVARDKPQRGGVYVVIDKGLVKAVYADRPQGLFIIDQEELREDPGTDRAKRMQADQDRLDLLCKTGKLVEL